MSRVRLAHILPIVALLVLAGCGGESTASRNDSSETVGSRNDSSETIASRNDSSPGLAGASGPSLPKLSPDEGPVARGATSTTADVAGVCLSPQEAELGRLINEYRATQGLPAVQISKSLTLVAQQHAWDSVNNSDAWPVDPGGQECNLHSWTGNVNAALTEGTWSAVCYTDDHANMRGMHVKPREIAGYQGDGFENSHWASNGATAASALNGWQNSPGHNAVITEQNGWGPFLALGIGINGPFANMWVGEVVDPAGSPPLCGGGTVEQPPAATEAPPAEPTAAAVPTEEVPVDAPPTTGEILNQAGTIVGAGIAHTFDVSANQRYRVIITPSAEFDAAAQYTCTTGNGTQSGSVDSEWEGGAESFAINVPAGGSCTVSVSGYNGSTGDYTITVATE